jgi:type I restriction enzyme M protein
MTNLVMLFTGFAEISDTIEKRLAKWGDDDDDDEEENDSGAKKSLPDKKKKKLLDDSTWQRDARLVEIATTLRASLGDQLYEDHKSSVTVSIPCLRMRRSSSLPLTAGRF